MPVPPKTLSKCLKAHSGDITITGAATTSGDITAGGEVNDPAGSMAEMRSLPNGSPRGLACRD